MRPVGYLILGVYALGVVMLAVYGLVRLWGAITGRGPGDF